MTNVKYCKTHTMLLLACTLIASAGLALTAVDVYMHFFISPPVLPPPPCNTLVSEKWFACNVLPDLVVLA